MKIGKKKKVEEPKEVKTQEEIVAATETDGGLGAEELIEELELAKDVEIND